MNRSATNRSATRDLVLRAMRLTTGVATVAVMGATGALTGALAATPPPPPADPTSSPPPAPTIVPMPRRIIHVPAKTVRVEVRVGARSRTGVARSTPAARPRKAALKPPAKRAPAKAPAKATATATTKAPVVTSGAS